MTSRISAELAHLARLARDGGLDLSQVSLRVKADLLMSAPRPSPDDLAAFGDMAAALIPGIDEATALILARKLAGWRHAPPAALQALRARGGDVFVTLLEHGLPLPAQEIETIAERGSAKAALALAARADLDATAVALLIARRDRAIDLAIAGNPAAVFTGQVLEQLVARSREDAELAGAVLARTELPNAALAPLFLLAGAERRVAILDALATAEAPLPPERRPALSGETFSGWLTMAGDDPDGAFGAIAHHLGGGPALAGAMARDTSRVAAAMALMAAGTSVEEATRFLIRLGDETAHSVAGIFSLVALMRAVRPAVALRLAMAIAGTPLPAARRGRHQPAMAPGGTPARPAPQQPTLAEIVNRLGQRREQG